MSCICSCCKAHSNLNPFSQGHNHPITCFRVVCRGNIIIVGAGVEVGLWDIETGRLLHRSFVPETITCILGPLQNYFFTCCDNGVIYGWDLSTCDMVAKFEGHVARITEGKIVNECSFITGSADGTIRTWDALAADNFEEVIFMKHTGPISGLKVLKRDSIVVSTSNDFSAWVWDVRTGEPFYKISRPGNTTALAVLRETGSIVMGDLQGITSYDLFTGHVQFHFFKARTVGSTRQTTDLFKLCTSLKQWGDHRVVSGHAGGELCIWEGDYNRDDFVLLVSVKGECFPPLLFPPFLVITRFPSFSSWKCNYQNPCS